MFLPAAAVLVVFGAVAHPSSPPAADPVPPAGDYRSRPVFFELHPEMTRVEGDELDLLRRGFLRLQHYDPVDVTRYAWERETFTAYTWWMQTQELRFLLPAIASNQASDRRLALEWFMRWYAVHMVPEPATTAWGEPMSAAYRAMVLVYLLKKEEARADRDEAVLASLRATLLEHQRWLVAPEHFDDRSNHGIIASLGLFETTRVFPDPGAAALALTRVEGLFDRLVSPAGVEREHSAGYHFTVMLWMEQIAEYLGALPSCPAELVDRFSNDVERMRGAGRFLQDHAGRVAPIGDTDSVHVDSYSRAFRVANDDPGPPSLFDPASGYAVHRGVAGRGDCRHVIFRIPGGVVEMRSHCHADALALFFSHAGETIVGDAGRYSYTSGPVREFCTSPFAHSTLTPHPLGTGWHGAHAIRLVRDAVDLSGEAETSWRASLSAGGAHYFRTVRVPARTRSISVIDSVVAVRDSGGSADELQLWQLGPDVTDVREATADGPGGRAWLLVTRRGQRLRLEVRAAGPGDSGVIDARVVRGQEEPMLGWYSPSQGVLRATTTLVVRLRRSPSVVAKTRIEVVEGECETGAPRLRSRR